MVWVEWDPEKAAANLRAHGIRFAEATTVLEDPFAITREDPVISAWKAGKRQRKQHEEGKG
jgi:uncharacterized DUF497 family protein